MISFVVGGGTRCSALQPRGIVFPSKCFQIGGLVFRAAPRQNKKRKKRKLGTRVLVFAAGACATSQLQGLRRCTARARIEAAFTRARKQRARRIPATVWFGRCRSPSAARRGFVPRCKKSWSRKKAVSAVRPAAAWRTSPGAR